MSDLQNQSLTSEASRQRSPEPEMIVGVPVASPAYAEATMQEVPDSSSLELLEIEIPISKAAKSLEKLVSTLKAKLTKSEFKHVDAQLRRKYGRLNFITPCFEDAIDEAVKGCTNEILLDPANKWKQVLKLLKYFDASGMNSNGCKRAEDKPVSDTQVSASATWEDELLAERKKQKRIRALEKTLKKYEDLIEEWDQKDEDWDDDYNSPYLVRTRLVNQYMKTYDALCKATNCTTLTGRPTQKKMNIEGVTKYPELNSAVETLLNSKGHLFVPDFHDMLNITKNVNTTKNLHLSSEDVHELSQDLFQKVVRMLQKRRQKDFRIAIKIEDELDQDPADADEELRRKLVQNKLIGRSEDQVLKEFTERQTDLKLAPKDVCEDNPDDSAEESDDEEDSEAEKAECGVQELDNNGETKSLGGSSPENGVGRSSTTCKQDCETETIELEDSDSETSSSITDPLGDDIQLPETKIAKKDVNLFCESSSKRDYETIELDDSDADTDFESPPKDIATKLDTCSSKGNKKRRLGCR